MVAVVCLTLRFRQNFVGHSLESSTSSIWWMYPKTLNKFTPTHSHLHSNFLCVLSHCQCKWNKFIVQISVPEVSMHKLDLSIVWECIVYLVYVRIENDRKNREWDLASECHPKSFSIPLAFRAVLSAFYSVISSNSEWLLLACRVENTIPRRFIIQQFRRHMPR